MFSALVGKLSTSNSLTFKVFFLAALSLPQIRGSSLNVWGGQLVYYDENAKITFLEAKKTCENFGGKLPSIHSKNDVEELMRIMNTDELKYLWLGAKPENNFLKKNIEYEWTDGTPFDYSEWHVSDPNCKKSCCGLALVTLADSAGNRLIDDRCDWKVSFACVFPVLTNATAQSWLQDHLAKFNSSLEDASSFYTQNKLAIDILNETLINVQASNNQLNGKIGNLQNKLRESILKLTHENENRLSSISEINGTIDGLRVSIGHLESKFGSLKSHFKESFTKLNMSLMSDEDRFEELEDLVRRRTNNYSSEMAILGERNESYLASINIRSNIYLATLIFLALALAVLSFCKTNFFSWIKTKGKRYSRFSDSQVQDQTGSMNNVSRVSGFTNPVYSSVGVDSIDQMHDRVYNELSTSRA